MVGARNHRALRRQRFQFAWPHPAVAGRCDARHSRVRPGSLGSRARRGHAAAGARVCHHRGGARKYPAPPAPPQRRTVAQARHAQRRGRLFDGGLAPDLRRPPRGPRTPAGAQPRSLEGASMRGFFFRLLITALGLWVAATIVHGVSFTRWRSLLVAALLLGIVNAVVRPILLLLTFPITLMTLGLFILVVNGISLALVAWVVPGFHLAGLGASVVAALAVRVTGWFASSFVCHS